MSISPYPSNASRDAATKAQARPLVLVTGGTGYIGSHTCVCLQQAGYQVLIVDDLSNSEAEVLSSIASISGQEPLFEQADIRNVTALKNILARHRPAATIHFAGVKSVAESERDPVKYYDVNVAGSVALVKALRHVGVPVVVFSSSATVYGEPDYLPLREDHPLRPESAYGRSKLMVEQLLEDMCRADPAASVVALRYFNPVGAHATGRLGEAPRGTPENLMPHLGRVATGVTSVLNVFGGDYPTPDGTCVRDYVHVMDLAEAHVAAVHLALTTRSFRAINIGTGTGVSVLDLINAYGAACGHSVPYQVVARRPGDVACYYADPEAARAKLGWRARRGLREMCDDAYRHVTRCHAASAPDHPVRSVASHQRAI